MPENEFYKIEYYKTGKGSCPVEEYKNELAKNNNNLLLISKIDLYIDKLAEHGHNINKDFKKNASKKLDEDIFELRPDKTRVLFFFCDEDGCYVLLHAFTKSSQKTPPNEIKNARNEMKDYKRRKKNGK